MNLDRNIIPPHRPPPGPDNDFYCAHIERLRRSLIALNGRDLTPGVPVPETAARMLWDHPSLLLSHGTEPDPILNYGNRATLELFELDWDSLVRMPSRLTAEAPDRAERERLFQNVARHGYIDDYQGVRISSSGRRFRIEKATVWTVRNPDGSIAGQAAWIQHWSPAFSSQTPPG